MNKRIKKKHIDNHQEYLLKSVECVSQLDNCFAKLSKPYTKTTKSIRTFTYIRKKNKLPKFYKGLK